MAEGRHRPRGRPRPLRLARRRPLARPAPATAGSGSAPDGRLRGRHQRLRHRRDAGRVDPCAQTAITRGIQRPDQPRRRRLRLGPARPHPRERRHQPRRRTARRNHPRRRRRRRRRPPRHRRRPTPASAWSRGRPRPQRRSRPGLRRSRRPHRPRVRRARPLRRLDRRDLRLVVLLNASWASARTRPPSCPDKTSDGKGMIYLLSASAARIVFFVIGLIVGKLGTARRRVTTHGGSQMSNGKTKLTDPGLQINPRPSF